MMSCAVATDGVTAMTAVANSANVTARNAARDVMRLPVSQTMALWVRVLQAVGAQAFAEG